MTEHEPDESVEELQHALEVAEAYVVSLRARVERAKARSKRRPLVRRTVLLDVDVDAILDRVGDASDYVSRLLMRSNAEGVSLPLPPPVDSVTEMYSILLRKLPSTMQAQRLANDDGNIVVVWSHPDGTGLLVVRRVAESGEWELRHPSGRVEPTHTTSPRLVVTNIVSAARKNRSEHLLRLLEKELPGALDSPVKIDCSGRSIILRDEQGECRLTVYVSESDDKYVIRREGGPYTQRRYPTTTSVESVAAIVAAAYAAWTGEGQDGL